MEKQYKAIIIDDEPTAREIIESHLSKIEIIDCLGSFKNAIEAFSFMNNNTVDLVFLDINMPEVSGLSFAKTLTEGVKVIFTTAYREYAIDGFDLQAVDYLLKPISLDRFIQAINKFLGETIPAKPQASSELDQEKNDFVFVRSDRKMIKVDFSEILHIESLSDYIKIFTTHKTITTRETISNIESKLPTNKFIRCHRSFIVSIDKIDSFTNEHIEINGKALSISRSYRPNTLKRLGGL